MQQSNVQRGLIQRNAFQDLTGFRSFLAKLVNNGGDPQIALPTAITDMCPYIVTDDNVAGKPAGVEPLHSEKNARIPLVGNCTTGDPLVLADPTVAGQAGMLQSLTGLAAGTYRLIGIAEENGVNGQYVLLRPVAQTLVTV